MELWQALLLAVVALAVGFFVGRALGGNALLARVRLTPDDARRLETDTALGG